MNVAPLAKLLHRFEQEVDPFQIDQLTNVEHVIARLVGSLWETSGGAEHVGRNAVGNGVDLVGASHAAVVSRLRMRQRDVCFRPVHYVLEGVAPQPRAFPARGDQPSVAGEDGARPARRRRHLECRPAEVMDVNDVVVVRWLKPGVSDRVHLHASLTEAVEQHRLRGHPLLRANRLEPIEDPADQANLHATSGWSRCETVDEHQTATFLTAKWAYI